MEQSCSLTSFLPFCIQGRNRLLAASNSKAQQQLNEAVQDLALLKQKGEEDAARLQEQDALVRQLEQDLALRSASLGAPNTTSLSLDFSPLQKSSEFAILDTSSMMSISHEKSLISAFECSCGQSSEPSEKTSGGVASCPEGPVGKGGGSGGLLQVVTQQRDRFRKR